MNELESMETSVVMMENAVEEREVEVPQAFEPSDHLLAEARSLQAIYPDFDLTAEMEHPVLGALLRGEGTPTLRQLYEAVHMEDITEGRIATAVESAVAVAVAEAVSRAVRETEERLLGHIRARGQRPDENGLRAATGIRMHPAAGRLTRRERAMLAKRAENGETIQL